MISVHFHSCGWYVQGTLVLCPCCAHTRLISAINADLCYTHFPALFLFYFVITSPAHIGALSSIQRRGNIFLTETNPRSEGLQELWAQGSRNAEFCSLTSNICSIGKDIIISLYKYSPLAHHQTPGSASRELERAPWFRETHSNLTSAASLNRPFPEFLSWTSFIPIPQQRYFFFPLICSLVDACYELKYSDIYIYIGKIYP